MGILTKEVEVKPSGKMIQYYKDKGYDVKYREPLMVKVEDLPKYSTKKIQVICDMCKENTMLVTYENYTMVIEKSGNYVCRNCAYKKVKQTVNYRYNVDSVSQLAEIRRKAKDTMMKNYNVEYALQNESLKKRAMDTTKKRYGVEYAMQSHEILQKVNKTLYKNDIRKASIQQTYLCFLYGGILNYPIKHYASDICFPEEKISIEYNGGGHDLCVRFGTFTEQEFKNREIIRSRVIKQEGFKQIYIISTKDLLPFDNVLLQMLEHAKQYFSNYPNHSWIEFNIDTSTVRNAEQKDGVFFNYGELRRIKKSDIQNEEYVEAVNCA